MTSTDVQIDDWVIHRPNVVRSVAARVPGVDADEAASRALEKMIRIVNNDGDIQDPAAYWRRAALNEAYSITREAGRAVPVEDEALADIAPAVAGAELGAEREADVRMLRDALSDLNDDDRKLLLNRHVDDMAVTDIAGDLGVRPHAVTMRLRRAEERLAGAFAAAHARQVNEPECRTTRAAMHDYLKGRLLPRRSKRLELHMDGCAECTNAFLDVREVSWMLRELGQHLVAAFFGGAAVSTAATLAVTTAKPRPRPTTKQAVAASVLALLALSGGAFAYLATEPDPLAGAAPDVTQADGDGDGSGGGTGGGGDGAGGDGAGGDGAGGDGAGAAGDEAADADGDSPATETETEPEPEAEPEPPRDEPRPREEFPPPLDRPAPQEPATEDPPADDPAPVAPRDPAPAPEPAPQPDPGNNGGNGNNGGGDNGGNDGGNNGDGGGQDGGNDGDNGGGQDDDPEDAEGGLANVLGELPLGGLENVLGGLGDVPVLGDVLNLPAFSELANALNDSGAVDGLTGGEQGG